MELFFQWLHGEAPEQVIMNTGLYCVQTYIFPAVIAIAGLVIVLNMKIKLAIMNREIVRARTNTRGDDDD